MPPLPIPDISLVPPSDMEESCRSSATPDIGWPLDGVGNVPEPAWPLPFPLVSADTDTAFQFQTDFLGFAQDVPDDFMAHWARAVRHGAGTPGWQAFVGYWLARMPGDDKRYALFLRLIRNFDRLEIHLRLSALECMLMDGPAGRAAVLRHWRRLGLGRFARAHWATVRRLLRDAAMAR